MKVKALETREKASLGVEHARKQRGDERGGGGKERIRFIYDKFVFD